TTNATHLAAQKSKCPSALPRLHLYPSLCRESCSHCDSKHNHFSALSLLHLPGGWSTTAIATATVTTRKDSCYRNGGPDNAFLSLIIISQKYFQMCGPSLPETPLSPPHVSRSSVQCDIWHY
ncbi:hypothetical protein U0070_015077, partial [Myodes glareolus]